MKIENDRLESVLDALKDLAANRLPGAAAFEVMKVKRAVATAYGTVIEARDALIVAHAPEGRIDPAHEAWTAFLPEHDALMGEESEVDCQPLDPKGWLSAVEIKPDSLGILDFVGLLKAL